MRNDGGSGVGGDAHALPDCVCAVGPWDCFYLALARVMALYQSACGHAKDEIGVGVESLNCLEGLSEEILCSELCEGE